MAIPIYQVDAFARRPFEGNPAAVCPLDTWLDERLMQQIAQENNLSETAFFVKEGDAYHIRWFTPQNEIDLCGHATLAAAHVLWHDLGDEAEVLIFRCQVGELQVERDGDRLVLNFPARPASATEPAPGALQALGIEKAVHTAAVQDKLLVELANEDQVAALSPNMAALADLPYRAFFVTAPAERYDFVNRMFAPAIGIDEDPVTGSAYTTLGPYWAAKLGRSELRARQMSRRGGDVFVSLNGERVEISGYAVCVMRGELLV